MAEPLRTEASHWPPHYLGYDGWDYIDQCPRERWIVIASWGLDGWDLGSWPLVTVAIQKGLREIREPEDGWGLRIYTEGDLDTRWYGSREALISGVDDWAAWWWRLKKQGGYDHGFPEGLPDAGPLPERMRGMFSWERLTQHEEALEAAREAAAPGGALDANDIEPSLRNGEAQQQESG